MSFKADYGLRLWSNRAKDDSTLVFAPFSLFGLNVDPEVGLYTTTSDVHENGEIFALTLDFDRETFDATLDLLPVEFARRIRTDLSQGLSQPKSYRFPAPVSIVVEAGFGDKQTNEAETYLPLKVSSVRIYM